MVAAYVSGDRAHEVPAVMEALSLSPSNGFELAFNQACAHLSVGHPQKAEEELLLAQRLGQPCSIYMDTAKNNNDASCMYAGCLRQQLLDAMPPLQKSRGRLINGVGFCQTWMALSWRSTSYVLVADWASCSTQRNSCHGWQHWINGAPLLHAVHEL